MSHLTSACSGRGSWPDKVDTLTSWLRSVTMARTKAPTKVHRYSAEFPGKPAGVRGGHVARDGPRQSLALHTGAGIRRLLMVSHAALAELFARRVRTVRSRLEAAPTGRNVVRQGGIQSAGAAGGRLLRSSRAPDARGVPGRRRHGLLRTPWGPGADRAVRSRAPERAAAAAGETQSRTPAAVAPAKQEPHAVREYKGTAPGPRGKRKPPRSGTKA